MKIKSLFAVALVGLALASTSNATVVQISLNQVFTLSSSAGEIDITGDGNVDNVEFFIMPPMDMGSSPILTLRSYNNPNAPGDWAGVAYAFFEEGNFFGDSYITSVYFTDERINGGARTFGSIEGDWGFNPDLGGPFVTAVRVVFDNASTVDPTGGNLAPSYQEFTPAAVPEPSAMALVGLGAMSLFARRRRN
jgi:hypothetical protein